jgi:hypothetical protein
MSEVELRPKFVPPMLFVFMAKQIVRSRQIPYADFALKGRN